MNLCKSCGISGLGDTLDLSALYPVDYSNPGSSSVYDAVSAGGGLGPASTINTSTTSVTPSLVAGIASAFSSIFKTIQPLPAGCTVVAGPYGQSTSCSGTGTNPLGSSLIGGSLLGGTSVSPVLLIGAAVLLFMMMKK